MERVINFLKELRINNNREWFAAHKDEYKRVQAEIDELASKLIDRISAFDDSIRGLSVKECTYRIYRDTRFSPDKTPYKTHTGIYICSGGKKSGRAGYYLHIEPPVKMREGESLSSGPSAGYMLTSGIYMPEPAVLHSVREDICYNGEAFEASVAKASGFHLSEYNKLKRLPVGFPADTPYSEYLKLKDVYLEMQVNQDFILAPGLAERCAEEFSRTYDFSRRLNMAVDYARENK